MPAVLHYKDNKGGVMPENTPKLKAFEMKMKKLDKKISALNAHRFDHPEEITLLHEGEMSLPFKDDLIHIEEDISDEHLQEEDLACAALLPVEAEILELVAKKQKLLKKK